MTEFLLNKVLLITFILSVLNCIKHVWGLVNRLREDVPSKYEISTGERFLLGLSISYIITSIFTGLQL
jgi:hypothetical protein